MSVPPINSTTRQRIEEAVERLLALLDRIDGDPDFEEQHDAETNGDELDHNGDEFDYSHCEDDALAVQLHNLPFGPLAGGQGL